MSLEFPVSHAVSPVPDEKRARILADPGFGRYFTDHMVKAHYREGRGWHDGRVVPLENYHLHPATGVLHYAQTIFEGLKAYRHRDGRIALFRPDKNAARFAASARRLALPPVDESDFVAAVGALVDTDRVWVPDPGSGASLYVRPFMFAAEAFLGIRPSDDVEFGVIASPAASFFAGGDDGIALWVTDTYVRAAPGGTGAAKCGGNYAASLAAQVEARKQGCDQVLYTAGDPARPVLDESGTMNIFLVTSENELVTPRLGTILDGVTRSSVLTLAAKHGLRAVERDIPLSELVSGAQSGDVREMFAAGTAAVITPISRVAGTGFDVRVGEGGAGPATTQLRDHLVGIQRGTEIDEHDWLHIIS